LALNVFMKELDVVWSGGLRGGNPPAELCHAL
jgi:hypothetical protein